jgi:Predicted membrane protein
LPPEAEKPGEPPLPPKPDGVKPEDLAPGQKPETPLGPDGKPLDPKATPGTPPATPPGTPPGAQPGVPQGTLQIPPDAPNSGTAGFLGGTWKSETGLVEKSTGKPLQQSYRFDQQGKGEVTVRRPDGAECRAPAQARMQGGRLSIEETGDPRCPDGSTYNRSKTECSRTPSGQTVCVGRNPDGSTYRVGIQRQP